MVAETFVIDINGGEITTWKSFWYRAHWGMLIGRSMYDWWRGFEKKGQQSLIIGILGTRSFSSMFPSMPKGEIVGRLERLLEDWFDDDMLHAWLSLSLMSR